MKQNTLQSRLQVTTRVTLYCLLAFCALLLLISTTPDSATAATRVPRTPRPTRSSINGGVGGIGDKGAIGATATALVARLHETATAFSSKVAPTLTALALKIDVTATKPADEAAAAITSYAVNVLGSTVDVKSASGVSAQVSRNLNWTKETEDAKTAASSLAVNAYNAVLNGGSAWLGYGVGTISGDINVDVQDESLGIYTLVVTSASPLDANSALNLALTTFPGLFGHTFTVYPSEKGFTWYAYDQISVIGSTTKTVQTSAQGILIYIYQTEKGKVSITATVGRGQYASLITMQGR